jgi:hypothetical protein
MSPFDRVTDQRESRDREIETPEPDPRVMQLLDGSGGALRGDHDDDVDGTELQRDPEHDLEVQLVATPYGDAHQSPDPESLALRERAEGGELVYRHGVLGVQQGPEAQFWSGTHPLLDQGFADRYGLPAGNAHETGHRFFIAAATLDPDGRYVTRPAPGVGVNGGGAPELVVAPGDVTMRWFHMPDDD